MILLHMLELWLTKYLFSIFPNIMLLTVKLAGQVHILVIEFSDLWYQLIVENNFSLFSLGKAHSYIFNRICITAPVKCYKSSVEQKIVNYALEYPSNHIRAMPNSSTPRCPASQKITVKAKGKNF